MGLIAMRMKVLSERDGTNSSQAPPAAALSNVMFRCNHGLQESLNSSLWEGRCTAGGSAAPALLLGYVP